MISKYFDILDALDVLEKKKSKLSRRTKKGSTRWYQGNNLQAEEESFWNETRMDIQPDLTEKEIVRGEAREFSIWISIKVQQQTLGCVRWPFDWKSLGKAMKKKNFFEMIFWQKTFCHNCVKGERGTQN